MNRYIYVIRVWLVLWMLFLGAAAGTAAEPLILLVSHTDSASIDSTYHSSFPDALRTANKVPRASMLLLNDVDFGGKAGSQSVKSNLTIDLNGYTLGDTLTSTSFLSLSVDTLTMRVTSSRPGGRIAVCRAYNGRINAISCSKGKLVLDHITVEARNTAVYHADTCKNVAVTAVTVGATASMQMNDCRVYASSMGSVTAVTGSGKDAYAAHLDLHSSFLRAEGQLRVYGVNCYATSSLADCEVEVSASENPAYGIMVRNVLDSIQMQDVRGTIQGTRVKVSSLKQAYGIYTYAPLNVANDTIQTQTEWESSYAFFATRDSSLFALNRSHFMSEAGAKNAYGVYLSKGKIEAEDCFFSGTVRQDTALVPAETGARGVLVSAHCGLTLNRCTVRSAGTNHEAARGVCGISASTTSIVLVRACDIAAEGAESTTAIRGSGDKSSSAQLEIRDSRLRATSSGKSAYGISCYSTASISDCNIEAKTTANSAYGVYVNQFRDSVTQAVERASMDRCAVTVSAQRLGYGIYTRGGINLNNDTLTVNVRDSDAYALYIGTFEDDTITVRACCLKSAAPKKNSFVNKNLNMEGRVYFYIGFYSHDTNLRMYMPEGFGMYRLFDGEEYQAGYRYTIQPVANPDAVVARMYNTRTGAHIADYKRVADALWYANFHQENELTIVIVADCQLDWSTYIVPKHTTLVIGYKDDQTKAIGTRALRSYSITKKWQHFARLELLDDAELVVEGVLEVSGVQQAEGSLCGSVSGEFGFGQMHLAPTASVVLEPGARLQAWGYITGSGTITAKSGAKVYEFLQLGDWKGATVTYEMLNNPYKVFPLTHFFYQNIECPLVYHAGCKAFGSTMITAGSYSSTLDDICLIDDHDALFLFPQNDKNATIRKAYDPITDRVLWTTEGNMVIDQLGLYMSVGLEHYDLVSSMYILPLGTNMTIRALSGTLEMKHDVVMLPGAKMQIAPDARLHVPQNVSMYLYDTDRWSWYGTNEKGYATISYSPGWTDCPRDTTLTDARMEIGGTVLVDGALYTTEGGAAIVGTDTSAGRIIFTHGALPNAALYQMTGTRYEHQYLSSLAAMPALLNADSSRTWTKKALEGAIYTYTDGRWFSADTIVDMLPDTIPADTVPGQIEDSTEWFTIPYSDRQAKRILRNGTIYILTPDGEYYTLLGLPGRKEEIQ